MFSNDVWIVPDYDYILSADSRVIMMSQERKPSSMDDNLSQDQYINKIIYLDNPYTVTDK